MYTHLQSRVWISDTGIALPVHVRACRWLPNADFQVRCYERKWRGVGHEILLTGQCCNHRWQTSWSARSRLLVLHEKTLPFRDLGVLSPWQCAWNLVATDPCVLCCRHCTLLFTSATSLTSGIDGHKTWLLLTVFSQGIFAVMSDAHFPHF